MTLRSNRKISGSNPFAGGDGQETGRREQREGTSTSGRTGNRNHSLGAPTGAANWEDWEDRVEDHTTPHHKTEEPEGSGEATDRQVTSFVVLKSYRCALGTYTEISGR